MKEEIKKVLNMSKAGTISEEQAAQLIDELMKKQKEEDLKASQAQSSTDEAATEEDENIGYPHQDGSSEEMNWAWGKFRHRHCHREFRGDHHRHFRHGRHFGGRHGHFKSYIHQAINDAMGDTFGGKADPGANEIAMSRVERPTGNVENFTGNRIHMSSVTDVHLAESEMRDNRIDASRLNDVRLMTGKFLKNQVSATSLNDVDIDQSVLQTNRLLGVKFHDVQILKNSTVERVEFNGCALKDFEVNDGSKLTTSSFNGVVLSDVEIQKTQFQESQFFHCEINDVFWFGCDWSQVRLRAFAMDDTNFTNTQFKDVSLKTTDGWSFRKRGFFDVQFENCKFEKAIFSNCRFADVKIKNVNLTDIKITDVQISDMEIDGNDAFLKAIGQAKKEHVS